MESKKGGLILTRKVGQSISVEDGLLIIEVKQIKGKQVRLRFIGNAKIDRAERIEEIEEELEETEDV